MPSARAVTRTPDRPACCGCDPSSGSCSTPTLRPHAPGSRRCAAVSTCQGNSSPHAPWVAAIPEWRRCRDAVACPPDWGRRGRPTRALAVRLQGLNPFGLLGERTAFGILARVGPPGEPPTTAQEQSQYRIPKQSFDSLCASPQAKGAIGPVRKSVERRLRMSDRAAERAFCRFVSRSFRRLSNSGVGGCE